MASTADTTPSAAPVPAPGSRGRDVAHAPGFARPGEVLVVEAATAEQALEEVAARLGDRVEILAAEKVRQGGVAGFFQRETCRLTVRVPGPGAGAPAATDLRTQGPAGLADVLDRLAAEATAEEDDFAEMLRRRLAEAPAHAAASAARAARAGDVATLAGRAPSQEPVAAPAEPPAAAQALDALARAEAAPAPVEPSVREIAARPEEQRVAPRIGWTRDPMAAPGTGPVRWSAGMLERLGLPPAIIAATEAQEPVDDAGWLLALAAAVAPFCRPLPAGQAVLAGPRAAVIAQALGVRVYKRPQLPPDDGPIALPIRDTLPSRDWLADVRRDRWLHVVVGGSGWHGLLFDEPLVVSWAGAEALPAALHQCAAFGLVLGYGTVGAGAPVLRANPVDVALSVRSLLPRR